MSATLARDRMPREQDSLAFRLLVLVPGVMRIGVRTKIYFRPPSKATNWMIGQYRIGLLPLSLQNYEY